ncbi:MAG: hypothetical protein AAFW47_06845 [Pseudomonadota bacterium]
MRKIVSSFGPIEDRSIAFAEEAVALAGVITALQQTSIAPSVKRAADDLSATFVAPVADGGTEDLASRQRAVVARVEKAIQAQSEALSKAADGILAREPVQPLRFKPLSTPEAVLLYGRDFLPSWAGAISIDLMPGVLILILSGVQAAIRREEGDAQDEHLITVAEMKRALLLYQDMPEHVLRRDNAIAPAQADARDRDERVDHSDPTAPSVASPPVASQVVPSQAVSGVTPLKPLASRSSDQASRDTLG